MPSGRPHDEGDRCGLRRTHIEYPDPKVHDDSRAAGPQAAKIAARTGKVREDADWRLTANAHPIIAAHPETDRKCLYVNAVYSQRLDGMSDTESSALLKFLTDHGNRPEFTCRLARENGSIATWDHRRTKHVALNDVPHFPRRMQRVQLSGGPIV